MRFRCATLVVLLAGVVALAGGQPVAAHDPSFIISNDAFYAHSLVTDGEYIAWRWGNTTPSSRSWGLFVARVSDATQIFSTTVASGSHAIGDDKVVWERRFRGVDENNQTIADPGIYGQNLITGEPFTVTTESTYNLAMHGSVVVWVACGTTGHNDCAIRMRDLAGGDTVDVARTQRYYLGGGLHYNGYVVTWQETDSAYGERVYLMGVRQGEQPVQLLSETKIGRYDLNGNLLVWVDANRNLTVRDLSTSAIRVLADVMVDQHLIATDGRYVVWGQVGDTSDAAVFAWDTATDSRFTVITYPAPDNLVLDVACANGVITWRHWGGNTGPKELRAAHLADVLPTGREPDPGTTDPAWNYYPETGHYLSQGFRDYWEANGGLPVFGYPLTEEYYQHGFPAQFTERQRFEWHAENIGTPYQVLLGRLGAELLVAQGRDWTTFPKADPAAPQYMPETGHAIAPEFWDDWTSHGLDLGDPDVSFRESLALFGYPLSEPMLETNADGDRVLTQYFERAVFEYHPDNPAEYSVLLRRLGAELLDTQGW
ncbi:MAG TPA: hypothetical protein VFV93_03805 [Thermomicrobiales bacterium]|nr:hypothetical protein [Thermomicrobiales bacterium]